MGHNSHTFAVLLLVDGQDEASPAAVATVVELVGMAASRAKRSLLVRGHRDFAATQCPGSGIYAQVAKGMFNDAPTKPTPPPAPPSPQPISAALSAATQGDIMMRFVASKDHPSPVRWVLSGAVRITPTFEAANYLVRTGQVSNGLDTADMLTDAELAGLPVVS